MDQCTEVRKRKRGDFPVFQGLIVIELIGIINPNLNIHGAIDKDQIRLAISSKIKEAIPVRVTEGNIFERVDRNKSGVPWVDDAK